MNLARISHKVPISQTYLTTRERVIFHSQSHPAVEQDFILLSYIIHSIAMN